MKTTFAKKETTQSVWYIIDADQIPLGRVAAKVADVIRGKNKPTFTPHADTGDFVVVINAGKVKLTGKKETQKTYFSYSGYVGGHKSESMEKIRSRRPQLLVERAVQGMVPRTRLGRAQLRKLKVYPGSEHPHAAQQLQQLKIAA